MESGLREDFRLGNRAALERVYRDHVGQVERFVRAGLARSRRLSPANLADVVQDVFLKAFADDARASYDGQREYAPLRLTIARNVVIDWLRRTSRGKHKQRVIAMSMVCAAAVLALGIGILRFRG